MNKNERDKAIDLMADRMEAGARWSGPGLHCITGDKTALAKRALDVLLENYDISKRLKAQPGNRK